MEAQRAVIGSAHCAVTHAAWFTHRRFELHPRSLYPEADAENASIGLANRDSVASKPTYGEVEAYLTAKLLASREAIRGKEEKIRKRSRLEAGSPTHAHMNAFGTDCRAGLEMRPPNPRRNTQPFAQPELPYSSTNERLQHVASRPDVEKDRPGFSKFINRAIMIMTTTSSWTNELTHYQDGGTPQKKRMKRTPCTTTPNTRGNTEASHRSAQLRGTPRMAKRTRVHTYIKTFACAPRRYAQRGGGGRGPRSLPSAHLCPHEAQVKFHYPRIHLGDRPVSAAQNEWKNTRCGSTYLPGWAQELEEGMVLLRTPRPAAWAWYTRYGGCYIDASPPPPPPPPMPGLPG
ncbi:hypothetical protein EVG20_g110 [Dentipellis fragilis]|uniref:Uncharacterized protein n=1 Tax=Dentipellis fragilis TaxID=205917 RepID=A0A4Y9ZFH6_9AGAM|nr:hypothetical protein EVG20_g110 [Dentipellis fragilis]